MKKDTLDLSSNSSFMTSEMMLCLKKRRVVKQLSDKSYLLRAYSYRFGFIRLFSVFYVNELQCVYSFSLSVSFKFILIDFNVWSQPACYGSILLYWHFDIYLRLKTEVRGYTSCVGLFFSLFLQGVENVHFIFWGVTDKILRPIFWLNIIWVVNICFP